MEHTLGHISGFLNALAFEQIAVAGTAVGLTPANLRPVDRSTNGDARMAYITVHTAPVRWRVDGVDPTIDIGHIAPVGSEIVLIGYNQLSKFRAIQDAGAAELAVTILR